MKKRTAITISANIFLSFLLLVFIKLFFLYDYDYSPEELSQIRHNKIEDKFLSIIKRDKLDSIKIIGNSPNTRALNTLNYNFTTGKMSYERDNKKSADSLEFPQNNNENTFYWINLTENGWDIKNRHCPDHFEKSKYLRGEYAYLCSKIKNKIKKSGLEILYKSGFLIFAYKARNNSLATSS